MSQTELARRATEAGLPLFQQQIQRIENLSRPVRLNEAVVLAQILNEDAMRMAGQMVDDVTASELLEATLKGAEADLRRTANTMQRMWEQLYAVVEQVDHRVDHYISYTRTREPGKYADQIAYFRRRQERLTATMNELFGSVQARRLAEHEAEDPANGEQDT